MKPSVKVVKSFVKQVQKYPLHFLLISAIMFQVNQLAIYGNESKTSCYFDFRLF